MEILSNFDQSVNLEPFKLDQLSAGVAHPTGN